ncbi:MAG: Mrp/NBP35 family ATP-binding protein [Pelagibacterales bacterium]|nr:Mrp/NBP35 family ATP-binding protein [Pelagibacterales bacterium]
MKEKVLQVLKSVSLENIGFLDKNIVDLGAIQGVVEKSGKIGFAIDLDALKINSEKGQEILKKCEEAIKKEIKCELTIVLTSHSSKEKFTEKETRKEKSNLAVKGVKKIIAVASAKGGVGKSTIACNLALALQKIGKNVALLDADIYGPSISHLMNLNEEPKVEDGLMQPFISWNVKCMSVGSVIDKNSAGIWRGPMVTKILHQLIHSVNWQSDGKEVDVMVIDMPPGTGDVYLSIAQNFEIDGVIIVSTPQSLSIIDVVKSIDCFKKLSIPIIGLIQNMSYLEINSVKKYIFGCDGAKKIANESGVKFLGEIPILEEISDSSEKKYPFVLNESEAQKLFLRLVKNLK